MPFSLILRGLTVQALVIMAWSFFLVVFNLQAEKMPFGIKLPLLSLPTLPVSLTSPSLGLLLVFRTNTAYSRWKAGKLFY
jgi:predicted membrane chloride channel (bestrophin family)